MKRAMIIGASQGLGAYLATRLVAAGWTVIGTGRRSPDQVGIAGDIDYVQVDLSAPDALELLSIRLRETTPDLIVLNAATYGDRSGATRTLTELEMIFRVNALLPFQLLLEYLPSTPQESFCSCVVINSDSIYHANLHTGPYAASKAALRVFTAALADVCRSRNASVSTLLLGPLATPRTVEELHGVAERRSLSDEEITRVFLRRSNPSYVIESLIDFEPCFQSILYIANLGHVANGMVCKLDGGSSGSLI